LRVKFGYEFKDNANPPRHALSIGIKTTLKFEFPDVGNQDIMIPVVNKEHVDSGAIERWKANRRTQTSTWIELDKSKVQTLAAKGSKIAAVYGGTQQLGAYIAAKEWTARITEITKKNDQNDKDGKVKKGVIEVKIQKDILYPNRI
jgi:hypothetical protein